jgi:hypothetical protein
MLPVTRIADAIHILKVLIGTHYAILGTLRDLLIFIFILNECRFQNEDKNK